MSNQEIESFDEATYLRANPDLQEALADGRITSALAHYRTFGRWEGRPGAPKYANLDEVHFANPLPPTALRRRVHGVDEIESFERVGKGVAEDLMEAVTLRMTLNAGTRALDFGCGCGRVMNYFARGFPGTIEGTDIDPEAIKWCQQNLHTVGRFGQNDAWPPLPYGDNSFDLVYSVSVFTHLPQEMEGAWLAELRRVAKPGALLLLSTHGDYIVPAGTETARQYAEQGFAYLRHGETAGLPEFYQLAYHAPRYIRERWGQTFDIETIIPRGIGDFQDLVICHKPRD